MKNDDLDTLLECAIREKGIMEHMTELDRRERQLRRRDGQFVYYSVDARPDIDRHEQQPERRRGHLFPYIIVAACLAAVACTGLKLCHDAKTAGYAFDPASVRTGGPEITALMTEGHIDEAFIGIECAREAIFAEKMAPTPADPERLQQLEADWQDLDLLEAVCLMRKGRYFKAKKALKAIIAEGGGRSAEAEQLLGSM